MTFKKSTKLKVFALTYLFIISMFTTYGIDKHLFSKAIFDFNSQYYFNFFFTLMAPILFYGLVGIVFFYISKKSMLGWYISISIVAYFTLSSLMGKEEVTTPNEKEVRTLENISLEKLQLAIKSNGLHEILEPIILKEQDELPKKITKFDTLLRVMFINGTNTKAYTHELSDGWESEVRKELNLKGKVTLSSSPIFVLSLNQQLINRLCKDPIEKVFLKNGVKYLHSYHQDDGTLLFKLYASEKQCNS